MLYLTFNSIPKESIRFFAKNTTINISANANNLKSYKVSGSNSHNEIESFYTEIESYENKLHVLYNKDMEAQKPKMKPL